MRSSLGGVLCGVLLCACGGRVANGDQQPELNVAPHDAGTVGHAGTGGATGSGTSSGPGLAGVPGVTQPGAGISVPPAAGTSTFNGVTPPVAPPPKILPPTRMEPPPSGESFDASNPNYIFGGITKDNRLVAAFWDGAREEVVFLDPQTGATTLLGYLDNLYWWEGQLVYDERARVVYALGSDFDDRRFVYTLSLDTGSTRTVPLADPPSDAGPSSYFVGGATRDGQLVAGYWAGDSQAVAFIDPATGRAKDTGMLGGLFAVSSRFMYDDATKMAYALGQDRTLAEHVYSFSFDTGATHVAELRSDVDGGRVNWQLGGVTRKKQLVAAYWDGSQEMIALLDPLTAETTVVGVLKGLASWSGQLFYNSADGTVVAYGLDANQTYHFYVVTIRG